jgi:hypothetical protein
METTEYSAYYRSLLTVSALLICMMNVSCSDSENRGKLLCGQWDNIDKGYVFWIEFSDDGTLRSEGVAGPLVGTWKLTPSRKLELSPYALESKVPEPSRQVEFEVTKDHLKIKGSGRFGGPRFERAK